MNTKINERGYEYLEVENQHLKLKDLKEKAPGLKNKYLFIEKIPASPQPEFHVTHLKHDTDQTGLRGIRRDNGFKNPGQGRLLWWRLSVGPKEIRSAEESLLETTFPDRTEEQAQMQPSFLEKFTTSAAFKKTSRYGSYRFTFPLEELLEAYSQQFCSGEPPVMRVLGTHLYKQEVMYAVLVHSPANQEEFSDHPLLPDDDPNAVCTYEDGHFIWRAEAMSATHNYKLVLIRDENQIRAWPVDPQFYVWDNVSLALHVDDQVLKFDADRLRENLKFCGEENRNKKRRSLVTTLPDKLISGVTFEDFAEAEKIVKDLWPDNRSPLEK